MACILHAVLLPVHAMARQSTQALDVALAAAGGVICHTPDPGSRDALPATATADVAPLSSSPDSPAHPAKDPCPICKGMAAFQFALLVTVSLGLIPPVAPPRFAVPAAVAAADTVLTAPRNRGPPRLA